MRIQKDSVLGWSLIGLGTFGAVLLAYVLTPPKRYRELARAQHALRFNGTGEEHF